MFDGYETAEERAKRLKKGVREAHINDKELLDFVDDLITAMNRLEEKKDAALMYMVHKSNNSKHAVNMGRILQGMDPDE